ncbi:MAG: DUF4142 domain-containing protein [Burkholderiaceae bacterium]
MTTDKDQHSSLRNKVSQGMDAVGGMAGQASAAMVSKAPDFVEQVSISDKYEIEAAQIALQRSSSEPVRELAQRMIDDHTHNSQELERALQEIRPEHDLKPAGALDSRRETMIDHLRSAQDTDFDDTYINQQVLAHQEAETLTSHYRDNGDQPRLTELAGNAHKVISSHLEHVKTMRDARR